MIYRAIGIMSGSSLDGLDIAFAELEESKGKWRYSIQAASCYAYNKSWQQKLLQAPTLNAFDYLKLHADFGKFIGEKINEFIKTHQLQHQVQLVASHGHTVFHEPAAGVTSQLGEGAVIAAQTGVNVISDLRAMDVALQGQGAPIVPMGEKLLLSEYSFLLNLGGIANITVQKNETYIAFDVCAANRILNLLSNEAGKPYDEKGLMAASGTFVPELFQALNDLSYYKQPYPKSLANAFGVEVVYPLIQSFHISIPDALRTYTEHIAYQIANAIKPFVEEASEPQHTLLVTGGGAHNRYLIEVLEEFLKEYGIHVYIPETYLIDYKEALIMALLGVLRWREENTVLSSVTGALRDSIGGAVWIGQPA